MTLLTAPESEVLQTIASLPQMSFSNFADAELSP
jgi:hypothetical protein